MIRIVPTERQAQGAFDGGRIRERKPIGFPQDGGEITPYSTLFYWAHAWSDAGGLIGEHPHKGFEIMSIVLTGEIEHYDSHFRGWKKLSAGDVQLIRAGNGITHAEKILKDSSIFQIWFDPDLNKTLGKAASYDDYRAKDIPVFADQESSTRVILGGGPVKMDSEVDYIQEITFTTEEKVFPLKSESVYSFFMLEGGMQVNGKPAAKGDFIIVESETELKLSSIKNGSRILIIKTPKRPSYATYSEMMMRR